MNNMRFVRNHIFIYFIVGIAAAESKTKDEDYRLPDIYVPISYYIKISVDHDAFTESGNEFTGEVELIFTVKNATNAIHIHAHHKYIKINKIQFHGRVLTSEDYSVNNVTDIMRININESSLTARSRGTLLIEYTGVLSTTENYGFYKSSYIDELGKKKYLVTTFFSPIYARRAFPCFDEPALKATFEFTFVFPNELNILFNTLPFYIDNNKTIGLKTMTFNQTPMMSTYLIAFIISDLTCSEGTPSGDVSVQVCSRNAAHDMRRLALIYGGPLLDYLNDYTGYNFMANMIRLSHVAIPDHTPYAMENWALITYKETYLLWDEHESSNFYKQEVLTFMAHELAHQWFGNLITPYWWSSLFLKEGFASYFMYHLTTALLPSWELDKQFVVYPQHTALLSDSSKDAQALQTDVYSQSAIQSRFSIISYYKGASIMKMVEHIMGKDRFQEGIRNYIGKYIYKNVEAKDVWEVFTSSIIVSFSHLPTDFTTVMENWIVKPGYPLLYVSVNERNVTISQKRFLFYGEDNTTRWYVPISYSTSVDPHKFEYTGPMLWLTPENNETIALPDNCNWIILNNKDSGYYRVNYDDSMWNNITTALLSYKFDGITDLNRAQIVDDLFNLARANQVTYTRVLNTIKFLVNDTSYFSWYPAFEGFDFLLDRVGEDSALGKSISRTILDWMSTLYSTVPISKLDQDDHIYTLKQISAYTWACRLGSQDCIQQVQKLFNKYKTSRMRPNKNLRPIVYCYALKHSNDISDWKFLWDAYTRSRVYETERATLLHTLGCSRDTAILKEYLNKSLTDGSEIKDQDIYDVFSSVYKSGPKGLEVAFEFLTENIETMAERNNSRDSFGYIINSIAEMFTTESQVSRLRKLIENENITKDFKASVNGALKTADKNLKWLEAHEDELTQYYKGTGYRTVGVSFWMLATTGFLVSNSI